jgi:hypothetical protein
MAYSRDALQDAPSPVDLRDGVLRETSNLGRPEGQHDSVLGDASLEQLRRDAVLDPVPLNPELAVDDVHVDQASMDPFAAIPSDVDQCIAIAGPVEVRIAVELTVGIGDFRIPNQNRFNDRTIAL